MRANVVWMLCRIGLGSSFWCPAMTLPGIKNQKVFLRACVKVSVSKCVQLSLVSCNLQAQPFEVELHRQLAWCLSCSKKAISAPGIPLSSQDVCKVANKLCTFWGLLIRAADLYTCLVACICGQTMCIPACVVISTVYAPMVFFGK